VATAAGYYAPNNSATTSADGVHYYYRGGIAAPQVPVPGWVGAWHFPSFGAGGTPDVGVGGLGNTWRMIVDGLGTLTVHTSAAGGAGYYIVRELYSGTWVTRGQGVVGTDLDVDLLATGYAGDYVHVVDVVSADASWNIGANPNWAGKLGAAGATWAIAEEPEEPEPPTVGVWIAPDGEMVDISDDVIRFRVSRGAAAEITGGATPGSATFVLRNDANQWNPTNAEGPYAGQLRDGMPIWLGLNSDGRGAGEDVRGVFGGRTTTWSPIPIPGHAHPPTVEVAAEDVLSWLRRVPVSLPLMIGASQRACREAVLDAAGVDEANRDLASEIITVPLVSIDGMAGSVLDEINKANGTRHFARPGSTAAAWFVYTTRNRQWRLDGTVDAELDDSSDAVTGSGGWRYDAGTVTNRQRATVTPIRWTVGTAEVWGAESLPLAVTSSRPYDVWIDFDDVVRNPIVNYAHSGGTGLTVTLDAFGDSAHLVITVTSGTATFSHLTIEGSLARRLPDESHVANDATSQALPRGVRAGADISGPFVGGFAAARGIAEHVVWRYSDVQARPTITVVNWFPEMLEVDLYDVIAFTSGQLGLAARLFEVVGLTIDGRHGADLAVESEVTYTLQECRVQSDPGWFVLDLSLLDGTDVLAY
jgi:hypothetical protein